MLCITYMTQWENLHSCWVELQFTYECLAIINLKSFWGRSLLQVECSTYLSRSWDRLTYTPSESTGMVYNLHLLSSGSDGNQQNFANSI